MRTIFVKPKEVERKWYVIDAAGQRLGRVAVEAADILRGKKKAAYTPHQEVGDYVIIINADQVAVSGRKATQKMYYRHSGYLGSLKSDSFQKMIGRKPQFPIEHAVRGMLPKNRLGRKLFTNLKVYAGPEHPHAAQKPEAVTLAAVKEA
ncbi:MAG: 50S ribosomal protein L13 [Spirochaetales bacterium]|nr:50S ribosomal protein L13 [Spirochaetales bacterium]